MKGKGQVHVYTGNGKGKTTAAFGLLLRAACAGKNVYVGQFVKDMKYSEANAGRLFHEGQVKIEQLGCGCFLERKPERRDRDKALNALAICAENMHNGEYDLVIMDELCIALNYELLTVAEVIDALENRKPSVEVVITGRYAPKELIDYADLVTEMQEVKHYYQKGILSRKGIDC